MTYDDMPEEMRQQVNGIVDQLRAWPYLERETNLRFVEYMLKNGYPPAMVGVTLDHPDPDTLVELWRIIIARVRAA